jgi:ribosomal protein L21E
MSYSNKYLKYKTKYMLQKSKRIHGGSSLTNYIDKLVQKIRENDKQK